ncbi:unnamed protein product, partial [Owenia fusiformis]
MSLAFVPQQQRGKPPPNQATIQKMLDENNQLINTIIDLQKKGKAPDCVQYQQVLHRNLVYLATIADSNQNMQQLLPAPNQTQVGPGQPVNRPMQGLAQMVGQQARPQGAMGQQMGQYQGQQPVMGQQSMGQQNMGMQQSMAPQGNMGPQSSVNQFQGNIGKLQGSTTQQVNMAQGQANMAQGQANMAQGQANMAQGQANMGQSQ